MGLHLHHYTSAKIPITSSKAYQVQIYARITDPFALLKSLEQMKKAEYGNLPSFDEGVTLSLY